MSRLYSDAPAAQSAAVAKGVAAVCREMADGVIGPEGTK
jgi:hypothetical protein